MNQAVPTLAVTVPFAMEFSERIRSLRKERGLTQQALAAHAGIAVLMVRRYEGGSSKPTFEVLRKLAVALRVSADQLLFDETERGPDEELRLQFEAVSKFDPEDKKIAKALLDGLILRHEAKRWAGGSVEPLTGAQAVTEQPRRRKKAARRKRGKVA